MIKENDVFHITGNSKQLWIEDYDVCVDTYATVEQTPRPQDKKVLVTLDDIDKETNVCVAIRRSALQPSCRIATRGLMV